MMGLASVPMATTAESTGNSNSLPGMGCGRRRPDVSRAQVQAAPAPGQPAWGRTHVTLRCSQGTTAWRMYLPLTVQVWAPALVSSFYSAREVRRA